MEDSEGCGEAVRVTGCVCVCVCFKGVVYFGGMSLTDSFVCYELKYPIKYSYCQTLQPWCNSPTDRCSLGVPESRAPPSRCLG